MTGPSVAFAAEPRIYADHAATTFVRPEVAQRMADVAASSGANPSSLHAEGRRARAALDDARERVARVLGARPHEIVFTGGGSESDTLAIRGAALSAARERGLGRPHALTTAIEHDAVLHAVASLEEDGFSTTVLPVGSAGDVDAAAFGAALRDETVIVSVMLANNETGAVQPVARLAALARSRGVLTHSDAVQAPGRLVLDVRALGVDLLTLSGHKFYGPKGVGALYVRDGLSLQPQSHGGGQEAGRRAGTENVAGIAGFALALELADAERDVEAARLARLRDRFETELRRLVPGVHLTGTNASRLPNLASFAVPDVDSALMLARLDLDGAAVSAGSACAAGAAQTSHVLRALGVANWIATGTIRVSFGRSNDEQEVRRLVGMVANIAATREGASLSGHRPIRF